MKRLLALAKELNHLSKVIVELLGLLLLIILVTYSMGYQGGMSLGKAVLPLDKLITPTFIYIWYATLAIYLLGLLVSGFMELRKIVSKKDSTSGNKMIKILGWFFNN